MKSATLTSSWQQWYGAKSRPCLCSQWPTVTCINSHNRRYNIQYRSYNDDSCYLSICYIYSENEWSLEHLHNSLIAIDWGEICAYTSLIGRLQQFIVNYLRDHGMKINAKWKAKRGGKLTTKSHTIEVNSIHTPHTQ